MKTIVVLRYSWNAQGGVAFSEFKPCARCWKSSG
jgi:hypothetical protein